MQTNTNSNSQPGQLNNLWKARQRAGLETKQVALLLSKKLPDEISRYERGINLPNLKTALKLEIVYQMPLRLLFAELFENLRVEVDEILRKNKQLFQGDIWFPKSAEQLKQEEFCFYADLLKSGIPNDIEMEAVTKHIIALSYTVSNYRQGLKPFEDEQFSKNGIDL